MNINKGITVYPSKLGKYNFHYPDKNNPYILNINIKAEALPWVATGKCIPVKVISPSEYLPYEVLWVKSPV